MSIQFKKFLCFVGSLVLGFAIASLFVLFYINAVGANSFGGELMFIIPPLVLIGIFSSYFFLKRIFKI